MSGLLVFAIVLLVAVLLSGYAARSVLSTAVIFLVAGFLVGPGVLGWVQTDPGDALVAAIVELALFSVLFTDGMRMGLNDLRAAWRLPGRALLFGMPLTLGGIALLAHWMTDQSWLEALLVGAILSPTDPVFAAAIVGREEVPARLRHLLNVESGLNDGLAFPLVLIFLGLTSRQPTSLWHLAYQVLAGIALGIVVPWIALEVRRAPLLSVTGIYEPLLPVAVAVVLYAGCKMLDINEFLAAFAAGSTIATLSEEGRKQFHDFGALIAEILKLGSLLLFGALITPGFFGDFSWQEYVFVLLVPLLVRPVALEASLASSALDWRERATAAWFGPKGFASVLFGLMVLHQGGPRLGHLARLTGLVVTFSIVAHSSTDVLVVRWFRRREEARSGREGAATVREDAAGRQPAHGDRRSGEEALEDDQAAGEGRR